ncbi:hypothetical protein GcC1_178028 [Golovinomyces cichoracearum]|uniref:Uncharacterized protein n=1 Tax=Golovinomyces cichoracearum TaxID=62708 RepID=A0A420HNQ6_9PEZI|nr:hypothetical protein GcC1_178028 [Golovinomyces cichoracearum]
MKHPVTTLWTRRILSKIYKAIIDTAPPRITVPDDSPSILRSLSRRPQAEQSPSSLNFSKLHEFLLRILMTGLPCNLKYKILGLSHYEMQEEEEEEEEEGEEEEGEEEEEESVVKCSELKFPEFLLH